MHQDFNYHTHTYRCQHAVGFDEQYVVSAIDNGYHYLGFSDHAPFPKGKEQRNRMNMDLFDDYVYSIAILKEQYKDTIKISTGIEAEYYLDCLDNLDMFFARLDYVILSIHGQYTTKQFSYAHFNQDEDIIKYADLVEKALPAYPWLYLAHPDYYFRGQNDINEACIATAHRVCAAAEKNNTILEVNLSGLVGNKDKYLQGDFYFSPNRLFWEIASEYNVKCIFGVDAHHPSVFNHHEYYDEALKELEGLNLNFIDKPLL